jgi:hypothetical protein
MGTLRCAVMCLTRGGPERPQHRELSAPCSSICPRRAKGRVPSMCGPTLHHAPLRIHLYASLWRRLPIGGWRRRHAWHAWRRREGRRHAGHARRRRDGRRHARPRREGRRRHARHAWRRHARHAWRRHARHAWRRHAWARHHEGRWPWASCRGRRPRRRDGPTRRWAGRRHGHAARRTVGCRWTGLSCRHSRLERGPILDKVHDVLAA